MADNFIANPGAGGSTFAADEIGAVLFPRSKIALGADGVNDGDVSASNPLPVTLPADQITALAPLATQPVSGSVSVSNMVAQGLTDTQIRATPLPVSGTVSTGLSQPLTDTQLRATAVPVSGTVAATQSGTWNIGSITTLPALATGTNTIGAVNIAAAQTLATVTTVGTVSAITAGPTAAAGLFVRVTDGTSTAAVKAASVVAAATDPAQVVTLSPQNAQASTLAVTVTAAANTAATLTLPAAGAGLFHYITAIEITRTATAALAGTATLVITTTNLPGSLAFSVGNAMVAGGTQKDKDMAYDSPLKSSVANTASTIVAPAPGAAVLWRITAFYYAAP